jgi:hypothetical protein
MFNNYIREAAFVVLAFALRITPRETAEWGRAMLAELGHIQGSWPALGWAFGCLVVLLGMSLKELAVRKTAAIVAACCVVLVASSFAIPTFRQGFDAALLSWRILFETRDPGSRDSDHWPDSDLRRMTSAAEEAHDGLALAFISTRLNETQRAARLAEEAVALDRNLTWLYGVVSVRHPYPVIRNLDSWVEQLHRWDPSNALPYLITAEADDIQRIQVPHGLSGDRRDEVWRRAMAGALGSSKGVDTYLNRQLEVDRDVVRRYRFRDALIFLQGYALSRKPSYAFSDVATYLKLNPFQALMSIRRGQRFEGSLLLEQLSELNAFTGIVQRPISLTWSVRAIQVSALLMFAFGLLLIVAAIDRLRHPTLPVAGGAGLLGCALVLYFSYRPFAIALDQFIRNGNTASLEALRRFDAVLKLPFGFYRYHGALLLTYFWGGVVVLCLLTLIAIGSRHIHLHLGRSSES